MRAEYIDHMGDDLRVCNAARVSFNKETQCEEDGTLAEKDVRLIQYLARNGHWTPFAQPQITLRLTVPLFVARQDFKHQIGFTRNEVSRRYVDDRPEFFQPETWRSRPEGNVKQGSGPALEPKVQGYFESEYESFLLDARTLYEEMLEHGVAPELARMVLPQSMYTSYYTTASLAAWARAYKQRTDPHAQQEIQELYREVGKSIAPLFPVSWLALTQPLSP